MSDAVSTVMKCPGSGFIPLSAGGPGLRGERDGTGSGFIPLSAGGPDQRGERDGTGSGFDDRRDVSPAQAKGSGKTFYGWPEDDEPGFTGSICFTAQMRCIKVSENIKGV